VPNYFIPREKYQLVEFLEKKFPEDKTLKRKNKTQLYAIYHSTMRNLIKCNNRQ
jgi:hypothetical protein